jgi:putative Ca2+/H+ antiporter (TMEM165/GDT1 family)
VACGAFGHGETNGWTSGTGGGGSAVVRPPLDWGRGMEAFLISISTVALAEMGDRTQLLSLLLATRFRRPWPILAGVLCATLANHAVAGVVGAWIGHQLTPAILDLAVGISMVAMALWMLKPDTLNENDGKQAQRGAFLTTLVAFFIAEIGDKTQIATLALAAGYPNLLAVIAGTTCGMLLANAPVVFLGNVFAGRLPMRAIHYATTLLLLIIGAVFIIRALHNWH